jgi:hypothetical protein
MWAIKNGPKQHKMVEFVQRYHTDIMNTTEHLSSYQRTTAGHIFFVGRFELTFGTSFPNTILEKIAVTALFLFFTFTVVQQLILCISEFIR